MGKPNRSVSRLCLLAAVATPVLYFGAQLAAAPFYPGYNGSLLSVSMLGTRFSRHPWIFNSGEVLTGIAALAGAAGLFQSFRSKSHFLVGLLIALSVASAGIMTLKAGLFPLPDPRHNSWGLLYNLTILIPFVMLVGLWKRHHGAGLRAYLIFSIGLLLLLIPLIHWLGHGTIQRLIAVATLVPVGVVGFFLWREPDGALPRRPDSTLPPQQGH